jgi:hypothetical protein
MLNYLYLWIFRSNFMVIIRSYIYIMTIKYFYLLPKISKKNWVFRLSFIVLMKFLIHFFSCLFKPFFFVQFNPCTRERVTHWKIIADWEKKKLVIAILATNDKVWYQKVLFNKKCLIVVVFCHHLTKKYKSKFENIYGFRFNFSIFNWFFC